jgi:hypothetical protein
MSSNIPITCLNSQFVGRSVILIHQFQLSIFCCGGFVKVRRPRNRAFSIALIPAIAGKFLAFLALKNFHINSLSHVE